VDTSSWWARTNWVCTPVYGAVHHLEELAHDATGALGGVVGWLVNTLASALLGLVIGALIVLVMNLTVHRRKASSAPH
jgi:predicted DNA repair protein MutK